MNIEKIANKKLISHSLKKIKFIIFWETVNLMNLKKNEKKERKKTHSFEGRINSIANFNRNSKVI